MYYLRDILGCIKKADEDYNLIEEGDTIYYDCIVPHHVHGYNGQSAKILAVVYTPI